MTMATLPIIPEIMLINVLSGCDISKKTSSNSERWNFWGVRQLIWMTRTTLPTEMWGVFFFSGNAKFLRLYGAK